VHGPEDAKQTAGAGCARNDAGQRAGRMRIRPNRAEAERVPTDQPSRVCLPD
jgi:hypothetical protein